MQITRAVLITIAAALLAMPSTAGAQTAAEKARAAAQAARERERERARERSEQERERAHQERERIREQQRVVERQREGDNRREQTEVFSKTVRIGAQGELDLHNMSGHITVTRGNGSDLTIEATKKARASTDEAAREMLGLVKIDVLERPGRVEVRSHHTYWKDHDRRQHRNISVSVTYNITAPPGTRLRLNSMSGGINVSDIAGDLVLEAMSGHITIERAARVVTAKSMSGHVTITDAKAEAANVGSMSGHLTLKQFRARRLDLAVVSGNVSLLDVDAERIDAQTTSGNVIFEGALARSGRYRFAAHSGNVRITLTGDTGFEVDANSHNGTVRSDVPLRQTVPAAAGGLLRGKALRGTYGDGSAVLDLMTFSGTIVITKR